MSIQTLFVSLIYQFPLLLVSLLGLVLSLILIPRAHGPALMAASACALLLITTVATPAVQMLFPSAGIPLFGVYQITVVGILANSLRAASFGLLMAAVFVGRGRQPMAAFPVVPNSR